MANLNKVLLTGNLTQEPDYKVTTNGTAILTLRVAVNDRRKVGDEWTDVPGFYDCVIIGRRAESLRQFLAKGRKVAIEGKLRYSSWEKDGHLRSKVEIAIDDLELLDSGRKRTDQVEAPALYDQEIPF
jgi:single-strand DNA-binding protein